MCINSILNYFKLKKKIELHTTNFLNFGNFEINFFLFFLLDLLLIVNLKYYNKIN